MKRALPAMLLTLLLAGEVAAQVADPSFERLRLIQDAARRDLDERYLKQPAAEKQLDFGAWITVTGVDLRDDDHAATTPDLIDGVIIGDLRVWGTYWWNEDVRLYARARVQNYHFNTAAGVPEPDLHLQEDPDVDLLYLDIDATRNTQVRAGRQFVRAGRGLTLSADLDGVQVEHVDGQWAFRGFGGTSLRRDLNVDTSIVGFDKGTQDRDFFLGEVRYTTRRGPKFTGYVLDERDHSRSLSPGQAMRNFRYDATYVAALVEGRILKHMHYYVEGVAEGGSTLADVPDRRVHIGAGAALAGLLYFPNGSWHPLASLEYAWGSGDPARASVTNVFGGKLTATPDRNFDYFGVYDGGLALSPRLSDLHVLRLGYQVKPLPEGDRQLPDLLVGGKASLYFKDDVNGAISDPLASLAVRTVGSGIDLFVGAKPYSDLSLLVQYGRFNPGGAYLPTTRDASNRVLATTTLSF